MKSINLTAMLHIATMNAFGGSQRLTNADKTPSEKSQRSPELVAQLKQKAEAKRQRKAEKRACDYHRCIRNNSCLRLKGSGNSIYISSNEKGELVLHD